MRQKREERLSPCLEEWTTDDEDMMKIIIKTNKKKNPHQLKPVKPLPHTQTHTNAQRKKQRKPESGPTSPKSITGREMFMCITGEKQHKKERHVMQTRHTTGSGGSRNEGMNFCVNMVECTLCMSVYGYICCHYRHLSTEWYGTNVLCSSFVCYINNDIIQMCFRQIKSYGSKRQ